MFLTACSIGILSMAAPPVPRHVLVVGGSGFLGEQIGMQQWRRD